MTHSTDIRFDDPITDLVFHALVQARAARRLLEDDIPPLLAHTRRPFAAHIARRCAGEALFDDAFGRDLGAFIAQLDTLLMAETHVEVHCDPDTGVSWEDPRHTPDGETLDHVAAALRRLRATLDAVADARAAETLRSAL